MALAPFAPTVTAGSGGGELPSIYNYGYDPLLSNVATAILDAKNAGAPGVFFPAGDYIFPAPLVTSGLNDFELRGLRNRSRLLVAVGSTEGTVIRLTNTNRLRIKDLTFVGRGQVDPTDAWTEAAIYINAGSELELLNCRFNEFSGYVTTFFNIDGLLVDGNRYRNNHSLAASFEDESSGDILVLTTTGTLPHRGTTITRNWCDSHNKIGIYCSYNTNLNVSFNHVIERLADGTEPTVAADVKRKEGIVLVYSYSSFETPGAPHDVVCVGNIVRHANWSGIYVNKSGYTDPNTGINVSISANVVEDFCANVLAGASTSNQAGISVHTTHQASITGNICKGGNRYSSSPAPGSSQFPAGIRWRGETGASRDAVTMTGNIVEHVIGLGFHLESLEMPVTFTGNSATDCIQPFTANLNADAVGLLNITGNTFRKGAAFAGYQTVVHIFASSATTRDRYKVVFVGNIVQLDVPLTIADLNQSDLVRMYVNRLVFQGNTIIGAGSVANSNGTGLRLWLPSEVTPEPIILRRDRINIGGNHFMHLFRGIQADSNTYNQHVGPVVDEGSTFENVATRYYAGSGTNHIYPGTRQGNLVTIYSAALPTVGTFRQGDQWYNTAPAAGGVYHQVCIAGGTPGTWKAEVALPA